MCVGLLWGSLFCSIALCASNNPSQRCDAPETDKILACGWGGWVTKQPSAEPSLGCVSALLLVHWWVTPDGWLQGGVSQSQCQPSGGQGLARGVSGAGGSLPVGEVGS